MRLWSRVRRCGVVPLVGVLAWGLGACTRSDPPRPGPVPAGSSSPGADVGATMPARWSVADGRGSGMGAVAEDTVVLWRTDDTPGRGTVLVGVSQSDGAQRWQRELTRDDQAVVAGGQVVIHGRGRGPVHVVDAVTGKDRWAVDEPVWVTIHQDTVYIDRYADQNNPPTGRPTVTARAVADGRTVWTVTEAPFGISRATIGAHPPYAPPATPFLSAVIVAPGSDPKMAVVDAASGRLLGGRAAGGGWFEFAVGDTIVVTDHDPPRGETRCTVELVATDRVTGAVRWRATVFSARARDGRCVKTLSPDRDRDLIGAGSRIAALSETGTPQLFDLATGRTVWTGATPAVPVDGDGRTLLTRPAPDSGDVAVLDFGTGERRWTLPDPAVPTQPGPTPSGPVPSGTALLGLTLTGRYLAAGTTTAGRNIVQVYDIGTGRPLHRFPGTVVAGGDDWLAISDNAGAAGRTLHFYRL